MFEPFEVSPAIPARVKTVKDIYGTSDPLIPTGYKAVAFRIVKKGELFLGSTIGPSVYTGQIGDTSSLRIILEPFPKRRVVTFTATGEKRRVLAGDWYKTDASEIFLQWSGQPSTGEYDVYTRTESEI